MGEDYKLIFLEDNKMKYKKIKNGYVDSNGNIFTDDFIEKKSKELKLSIEETIEYLFNSLDNCIDCIDCFYCKNCEKCENCIHCENCINCKKCKYCLNCKKCINCICCVNYVNCVNCRS